MKPTVVARAAQASLSFAIRSYRAVIGPWVPRSCRFAPSCSEYALDAIAIHGPWTGAFLAVSRLARCHPWHPGGYDPVPCAAHTDGEAAAPACVAASSSPPSAASIFQHRH